MIASVSSAAGDNRLGRRANCARSIVSAYSRRVRNCHPSAISVSSTPWSSAYTDRRAARAAWTACSPAGGSNDASSSSVRGREAANSAASSSFVRGCTRNHHRAEGLTLRKRHQAALGELEQGDERRQHIDDRGAAAHDVGPAKLLVVGEESIDLRRRALDVERTRDDA